MKEIKPIKVKIKVDTRDFEIGISKAILAVEKLGQALDSLKKPKWYQFWK